MEKLKKFVGGVFKFTKVIFSLLALILILQMSDQGNAMENSLADDSNYDLNDWFLDVDNEDSQDGELVGKISQKSKIVNEKILKISITGNEIEKPVLGFSFHLTYEKEKLGFLRYEPGDFLEKGGDPIYMVENKDIGKIIFGETLTGNDSFPIGSGDIVNFYFEILEEDFDDLSFQFYNGVVSSLDLVRQDIDKIIWENLTLSQDGKEFFSIGNGEQNLDTMVNFNNKKSDSKSLIGISLLILVFFLLVILFFLKIKKSEKKQAGNSVNFKS